MNTDTSDRCFFNTIKHKAFTLVELLVVIAIIGLLSTVVLITTKGLREKASITKNIVFDRQIENSLGAYLVGRWTFDEGSGSIAHDTSGWGIDGTLMNNPAWLTDTPSGRGYSLSFNGNNQYVKIENSGNLNFEIYTISAWIYPIKLTGQNTIIGKSTSTYDTTLWLEHRNNGDIFFGGYSSNQDKCYTDAGNKITVNKWQHLVGVKSLTKMKIYLDGVEIKSTDTTCTPLANDTLITIGRRYDSNSSFEGYMDDVRVYSAPLTMAQVKSTYYTGLDNLLAKGLITEKEYQDKLNNNA